MKPPPIVTLTTDFGARDGYVAAMKGVMLSIHPGLKLVDVTHAIRPHDVMEAAYVLRQMVPHFPEGTTHLAVVDPGVGSARRGVAVYHKGSCFVGPDNGLFTLLLETESPDAAVVLDRPDSYRVPEPSPTFHGRDIFAPVAAHLALGQPLESMGTALDLLHPLRWAQPVADSQGIRGWIVHIDRFGNCVTNIPHTIYAMHSAGRTAKCYAGAAILTGLHRTYSDVATGEPLMLVGSTGLLEVAVNQGNAAEALQIRMGMPVDVVFTAAEG